LQEQDKTEEEELQDDNLLRQLEINMLEKMSLCGIEGIERVFMSEVPKVSFDEDGAYKTNPNDLEKEWVLETEGKNLLAVMSSPDIDSRRTISNDIVEIIEVLGIEAVRNALYEELKKVISFDGAYVNYRHLATLVDVMTYRGHLTSITRHGRICIC